MPLYCQVVSPVAELVSSKPVLAQNQLAVVYTYGFWMATAYSSAIAIAIYHLAQNVPEHITDYSSIMFSYMFPFAILGARFFSWALEDNFDLRKILRPGFWWHGGLFGVLLGTFIGSSTYSLPMMPLLDSFGLAMPAFEIFNRTGCLSYGCCWGREAPMGHPHAIRFRNVDSCIHRKLADCRHKALYPVQVYAILLSALQFLVILMLSRLEVVSSFHGFLFLFGMATSSIVRLVCEIFRGDFRGGGFTSTKAFATMQLVAAFVLPLLTSSSIESLSSATGNSDVLYAALSDHAVCFALTFMAAFCAYGVQIKTEVSAPRRSSIKVPVVRRSLLS